MAKTPEGKVQKYGREQLTAHGCLCRKIAYEGRRGAPDFLVLVPKYQAEDRFRAYDFPPKVLFIEFKKSEDTEPEAHQLREHARMRERGADVRVIGSKAEVDALIEELFPCG